MLEGLIQETHLNITERAFLTEICALWCRLGLGKLLKLDIKRLFLSFLSSKLVMLSEEVLTFLKSFNY